MFGDEYGRGINEWANQYNQNTAPTNYNKEDASLLDYIPFVSNMYTSGEASRQVGNLVGQLAPDIAAVALTGGASLAVTGASLTARGAAVGLAKDAVKDLVKKHGYKEAVENIAQQEIAKGVSSGVVSSTITGARVAAESMPTVAKAAIGSMPMNIMQAGKSGGGVYGEMLHNNESREDAQYGALESFGGNLALNTVANTAHIMGALSAFGKSTSKANNQIANATKQSTDNVISGMESNPVLQAFRNAQNSTSYKLASVPAMAVFGGYEESIADDIDNAAITGQAFNPTLNPANFTPDQVQSFAAGALLGGAARGGGLVAGYLRDKNAPIPATTGNKVVANAPPSTSTNVNAVSQTPLANPSPQQPASVISQQPASVISQGPTSVPPQTSSTMSVKQEAIAMLQDPLFTGEPSLNPGDPSTLSHPLHAPLVEAMNNSDWVSVSGVLDQIKSTPITPNATVTPQDDAGSTNNSFVTPSVEDQNKSLVAPPVQHTQASANNPLLEQQVSNTTNNQNSPVSSPVQKAKLTKEAKALLKKNPQHPRARELEETLGGRVKNYSKMESLILEISKQQAAKGNQTPTTVKASFNPVVGEKEPALSDDDARFWGFKAGDTLASSMFGHVPKWATTDKTLGEVIRPMATKAKHVAKYVASYARHLFEKNITKAGDYLKHMRKALGDMWETAKRHVKNAYNALKKEMQSQRGSVRLGMPDKYVARQIKAANGSNKEYIAIMSEDKDTLDRTKIVAYQEVGNKAGFKITPHGVLLKANGKEMRDIIAKYTQSTTQDKSQAQEVTKTKATESQPKLKGLPLLKIISGGQSGVDMTALEIAQEIGLETGGTAPKEFVQDVNGKKVSNKALRDKYGLTENAMDDLERTNRYGEKYVDIYYDRTEQNVKDSDGTVIFAPADENNKIQADKSRGSFLTKQLADRHHRPVIINPTTEELAKWIKYNNIKTLNVAGSRAHTNKQMSTNVREVLGGLSQPQDKIPSKKLSFAVMNIDGSTSTFSTNKEAITHRNKEWGATQSTVRAKARELIIKLNQELIKASRDIKPKDQATISKIKNMGKQAKEMLKSLTKNKGEIDKYIIRDTIEKMELLNFNLTNERLNHTSIVKIQGIAQRIRDISQEAGNIKVISVDEGNNLTREQLQVHAANNSANSSSGKKQFRNQKDQHEIVEVGQSNKRQNKNTDDTQEDEYSEEAAEGAIDPNSKREDSTDKAIKELRIQANVGRSINPNETFAKINDLIKYIKKLEENPTTNSDKIDDLNAQLQKTKEKFMKAFMGRILDKAQSLSSRKDDSTKATLDMFQDGVAWFYELLNHYIHGTPITTLGTVNVSGEFAPMNLTKMVKNVPTQKTFYEAFPQVISKMNELVSKYADIGDSRMAKEVRLVSNAKTEYIAEHGTIPNDEQLRTYFIETSFNRDKKIAIEDKREVFDEERILASIGTKFDRAIAEVNRRTLAEVSSKVVATDSNANEDGDNHDPTGEARATIKEGAKTSDVEEKVIGKTAKISERHKRVLEIFNANAHKFTDTEVELFDDYMASAKHPLSLIDELPTSMHQKLFDIFKKEFGDEYINKASKPNISADSSEHQFKTRYVDNDNMSDKDMELIKQGQLNGYTFVGQGSIFNTPFQPVRTMVNGKQSVTPQSARASVAFFSDLLKLNLHMSNPPTSMEIAKKRKLLKLASAAKMQVDDLLALRKRILSNITELVGKKIVTHHRYVPNHAQVLASLARKYEISTAKVSKMKEDFSGQQETTGIYKAGNGITQDFAGRKTSLRPGDSSTESGSTAREQPGGLSKRPYTDRIVGFSPEEQKVVASIIEEHPHLAQYMSDRTDMRIIKGGKGHFINIPDALAVWRNGDMVTNPDYEITKESIHHEIAHDAYNRGYVPKIIIDKCHDQIIKNGERVLSSILSSKGGAAYINALKSTLNNELTNDKSAIMFAKKIWDNNNPEFASELGEVFGVKIDGTHQALMYYLADQSKANHTSKRIFKDYMIDEELAHKAPLDMNAPWVQSVLMDGGHETYIPSSAQYPLLARHITSNAAKWVYKKIVENPKSRDFFGIPDEGVVIHEKIKSGQMGLFDQWIASVSNVVKRHPVLGPIHRAAIHAAGVQERLLKYFSSKYDRIYDNLSKSERDDVRWIRIMTDEMRRELIDSVDLQNGRHQGKTLVLTVFDSRNLFSNKTEARQHITNVLQPNYNNTYLEFDGQRNMWVTYGWHNNQLFVNNAAANAYKHAQYNNVVLQLGLSPKIGKAVKDIRSLYNKMHHLVAAVNTLTGKPAPKYSKAYLPHYFEDFIVYMDDKEQKGMSFEIKDDAVRAANKLKRDHPNSEIKVKPKSMPKGHSNFMNEPSFVETITRDGAADIMNAASLGPTEFNEFANLKYSRNNEIERVIMASMIDTFDASQLSNILMTAGINQEVIAHSGIVDFAVRQGSVTKQQILNRIEATGGQHRGLSFMKNRKGVTGWSEDIEKVDRKYMHAIARYIAMEPFSYNTTRYYERYNSDKLTEEKGSQSVVRFGDEPPTDIAKYMKQLINDTNGKPSSMEEAVNKLFTENKVMYNLFGKHFGNRPGAKISNIVTQSMTVAKLGLSPASALLQLGQLLNVNAKLDADSSGVMKYVGFGKWTSEGFRRALAVMMGTGDYRDIKIIKQAGISIAKGMEHESIYTDSGIFAGDIGNLLKKTLVPFTFADRLVKATATLGFYHKQMQSNPNTNKRALLQKSREFMVQTNFDYGPHDSSNLHRRSGPIGQVLLQFKKYPVKQLEFVFDGLEDELGNRGLKGMIGNEGKVFWPSYLLWAGVMGVPGLALLKELAIALTGGAYDGEEKLKKALMTAAGDNQILQMAAKHVMYGGLANIPGFGADISKRIGMADLIPTSSNGLSGPMISTMYNTYHILMNNPMNQDTAMETVRAVSPGVGNMLRAIAGYSVSPHNRERTKIEYTPAERIVKSIGLAPIRESIETDQSNIITKENIRITKEKQYALDKYITNRSEANLKKVRELNITSEQIKNEIKRRSQSSTQRAIDSTPKKYQQARNEIMKFN